MIPVKADLAICRSLIGVSGYSARVWLSCQAIIRISVLAGLFRVFANPVTYNSVVHICLFSTLTLPVIAECTLFKDGLSKFLQASTIKAEKLFVCLSICPYHGIISVVSI